MDCKYIKADTVLPYSSALTRLKTNRLFYVPWPNLEIHCPYISLAHPVGRMH